MRHNKWMLGSIGCLVACAVPGGMGAMWGVLACVTCAGGCLQSGFGKKINLKKQSIKSIWKVWKKGVDKTPFPMPGRHHFSSLKC